MVSHLFSKFLMVLFYHLNFYNEEVSKGVNIVKAVRVSILTNSSHTVTSTLHNYVLTVYPKQ